MGVWVKWLNPTFDAADIRGLFYVVCLRGLFTWSVYIYTWSV